MDVRDGLRLLPCGSVHMFVMPHGASLRCYAVSGCLGLVLLPCQSHKMLQKAGPCLSSPTGPGGRSLRQRLAIEALPPQALRWFPPVSVVAAADGAVVHLHFNSGWDDRCSSKAIWTCHMGRAGVGGEKGRVRETV